MRPGACAIAIDGPWTRAFNTNARVSLLGGEISRGKCESPAASSTPSTAHETLTTDSRGIGYTMQGRSDEDWPITAEIIVRTLPISRLVEIATQFRIPLTEAPTWAEVSSALLADRALQAVPLIHLLSRRELGALCQTVSIRDEGPTQSVLAQLTPLCRPSPHGQANA